MIKKLFIILAICLTFLGCKEAKADNLTISDYLKKLPSLNQSVIFSLTDSKFDYASSVTLLSVWNERISFDIGYSPAVEALGLVSFKLVEVKDYIKFPILDLVVIEPFIYAGIDRIEKFKDLGEFSYGVGVKVLSLKF